MFSPRNHFGQRPSQAYPTSNDLIKALQLKSNEEVLFSRILQKNNQLFVRTQAFPIDENFDNTVMLAFYMGKVVPFKDDNELFLFAASSGRSQASKAAFTLVRFTRYVSSFRKMRNFYQ